MKYYSVTGFGKANFIEENEALENEISGHRKFYGFSSEKQNALNIIMQKYSHKISESFEYSKSALDKTTLIKVRI